MWAQRVPAGEVVFHAMHPGWADTPGVEPVAILVNRGWIAASRRREQLPEIATPQDVVLVRGIAMLPKLNYALASDHTPGPVRQGIELALRYAAACGALSTTKKGASAAAPTRDEVEAFLSRV